MIRRVGECYASDQWMASIHFGVIKSREVTIGHGGRGINVLQTYLLNFMGSMDQRIHGQGIIWTIKFVGISDMVGLMHPGISAFRFHLRLGYS